MQPPTPDVTPELFYVENLKKQLAQFKDKGQQWTQKQLRDFFNEAFLPQFIYEVTNFKVGFNYLNPLAESNRHIIISQHLSDLIVLLDTFGITPVFKNAKSPLGFAYYVNTGLYLWQYVAADFATHVVEPLFSKLKQYTPLIHLGLEYLRLYHLAEILPKQIGSANDSSIIEKLKKQHANTLITMPKIRTAIKEVIVSYVNVIRDAIGTKQLSSKVGSIIRDQEILQLSSETIKLSANVRSILLSLPDNNKIEDKKYRALKMLVFDTHYDNSLNLTAGLIFLMQQELAQTNNEHIIFNKIANLIAEISRDELRKLILKTTFSQAISDTRLHNTINYSDEFKILKDLLLKYLRKELLRYKAINLKNDLKKEKVNITDSAWADILPIFWHYYDNTPTRSRSYFLHDELISKNINDAANNVKRVEPHSAENAYVIRRKSPPQLTIDWLYAYIAEILYNLFLDNSSQKEGDFTEQHVLHSTTVNKLIISFHVIECFCIRDFAPKFFTTEMQLIGVNLELYKHINEAIKIQSIPNHLLETEKKLIMQRPSEEKTLTEMGLELLRKHIISDSRFVKMEEKHSLSSHPVALFSAKKQPPASHSSNGIELTTFSSPLNGKEHEGQKISNQRGNNYGTHRESESTSQPNSFVLDEEAIFVHEISNQDIKILIVEILQLNLVIYSGKQLEHECTTQGTQPVIHMSYTDSNRMVLLLDPFPKTLNIKSIFLAFARNVMTSAQLTKDEIISVLNPIIPVTKQLLNFNFSSENADYIDFALQVMKKCREENSTIPEILQFIKTNLPRTSNPPKGIIDKFDYIFYRFYGKSVADSPFGLTELIGRSSYQSGTNFRNNNSPR